MTSAINGGGKPVVREAIQAMQRSLASLNLEYELQQARETACDGSLPYLAFPHLESAKRISRAWTFEAEDQIAELERIAYRRTALLQLEYSWKYAHLQGKGSQSRAAKRLAESYALRAGVTITDLEKEGCINAFLNRY